MPEIVERFPLGPDVAAPAETRWREVHDFLGRDGVAYEMTGWGGVRATLYVVCDAAAAANLGRVASHAVPREPPAAGRAAAAWQADGLLYVLVVEGDAATYRGLSQPQPAFDLAERAAGSLVGEAWGAMSTPAANVRGSSMRR